MHNGALEHADKNSMTHITLMTADIGPLCEIMRNGSLEQKADAVSHVRSLDHEEAVEVALAVANLTMVDNFKPRLRFMPWCMLGTWPIVLFNASQSRPFLIIVHGLITSGIIMLNRYIARDYHRQHRKSQLTDWQSLAGRSDGRLAVAALKEMAYVPDNVGTMNELLLIDCLPQLTRDLATALGMMERVELRKLVSSKIGKLNIIALNAIAEIEDLDSIPFLRQLIRLTHSAEVRESGQACLERLLEVQKSAQSNSKLLRPAQTEAQTETLLRPSDSADTDDERQLLRPEEG